IRSRAASATPTISLPESFRMLTPSRLRCWMSRLTGFYLNGRAGWRRKLHRHRIRDRRNRFWDHSRRERHREAGTLTRFACHLDTAVVGFYNPINEAEAEPEALRLVRFGRPDAIETVEDVRQLFRRNADAGVRNGNLDLALLMRDFQRNGP